MNPAFQAMYKLLQTDSRYKFEAYNFVREALNLAQQERFRQTADAEEKDLFPNEQDDFSEEAKISRHITGQQLCEACRSHAIDQYGFMAPRVLGSWGITTTGDFGDIVYNLIRIDQMRKSDDDRREDFNDVYSFNSAFEPEFKLPTASE